MDEEYSRQVVGGAVMKGKTMVEFDRVCVSRLRGLLNSNRDQIFGGALVLRQEPRPPKTPMDA